MHKKMFLAACLTVLFISNASAHPVSYKGGYGVMPEYTSDRQDLELNYSFSTKAAVGVSSIHVQESSRNIEFVIPRFNYRLYRQNELDSQTNLYLYEGVGVSETHDETGVALMSGFQGDFETRRVYTLLSGENLHAEDGLDVSRVRYRAGVAPYVAGFNDFHTWLITQIEYTPDMDNEWTVSPLVRFFYQNYLVEVGSSTRGEVFVSGIFHF